MKRILSKFFRVAQEGDTIDGRKITRDWITQMASTYNPKTYGARVWLEHIRGIIPGGPFDALGDVHAVKAQEDDGKMGLYAQIEPSDALIAMNRKGQKIYSSIEVGLNFAKTGLAYLTGLAVTDDPASLGTERLEFSANHSSGLYKGPVLDDEHAYSVPVEVDLEFSTTNQDDPGAGTPTLLERVQAIFSRKDRKDDERFADVGDAMTEVAEKVAGLEEQTAAFSQQAEQLEELKSAHEDLTAKFTELSARLEGEEEPGHQGRQEAAGGNGRTVTDC